MDNPYSQIIGTNAKANQERNLKCSFVFVNGLTLQSRFAGCHSTARTAKLKASKALVINR